HSRSKASVRAIKRRSNSQLSHCVAYIAVEFAPVHASTTVHTNDPVQSARMKQSLTIGPHGGVASPHPTVQVLETTLPSAKSGRATWAAVSVCWLAGAGLPMSMRLFRMPIACEHSAFSHLSVMNPLVGVGPVVRRKKSRSPQKPQLLVPFPTSAPCAEQKL